MNDTSSAILYSLSQTDTNTLVPHDGTDVPGEVASAGGGAEVLLGVQAVRVRHEVTVGQVAVGA